jgi:hypothetical protein
VETQHVDRRDIPTGSIICENAFLRLSVLQAHGTLGVSLEALQQEETICALLHLPEQTDFSAGDHAADGCTYQYHSYDPVEIHGETRGIQLHGQLGPHAINMTALLCPTSAWCTFHVAVCAEAPMACAHLLQRWKFAEPAVTPDICWPPQPIYAQQLTGNPSAFFQIGPIFAALVPDFEEGDCSQLGLRLAQQGHLTLDYGIMNPDDHVVTLGHSSRFAYSICLDARAIPLRGFQQVVRTLGNHDVLEAVMAGHAVAPPGVHLPFPALADDTGWQPFAEEGSYTEIATVCHHAFTRTGSEDWQLLDKGLYWLDRLCFHQHLVEIPGGAPFGSFGEGDAWSTVAHWMPELLLRAFRLTGISEYAYRGIAAIGALPSDEQMQVLGELHEEYGDIFINSDCGEAILTPSTVK